MPLGVFHPPPCSIFVIKVEHKRRERYWEFSQCDFERFNSRNYSNFLRKEADTPRHNEFNKSAFYNKIFDEQHQVIKEAKENKFDTGEWIERWLKNIQPPLEGTNSDETTDNDEMGDCYDWSGCESACTSGNGTTNEIHDLPLWQRRALGLGNSTARKNSSKTRNDLMSKNLKNNSSCIKKRGSSNERLQSGCKKVGDNNDIEILVETLSQEDDKLVVNLDGLLKNGGEEMAVTLCCDNQIGTVGNVIEKRHIAVTQRGPRKEKLYLTSHPTSVF
eukprot:gene9923-10940_t